MSGIYFKPLSRIFLNLSGGTVSGDTVFTQGLYASRLSGGTIYSGGTNLEDIIKSLIVSDSHTFVQPGVNILTGGTALLPEINLADNIILNSVDAGFISGNTIYSAGTDLSTLINQRTFKVDFNIHTGNTDNPHLVTASQLSAYTISETDSIFNTKADISGSTFTGPISAPSISAIILSANTIYSGNTDLYDIFSTTNTYVTGFTYDNFNNLTITKNNNESLIANISVMSGLTINGDINVSGNSNLNTVTANTISNVDYIQFDTSYTGNTILEGKLFWDQDNGTLSLGMDNGNLIQHVGENLYYNIKNKTGSLLESGKVIRADGTLGSSGKILGDYMIADGSFHPKLTLGILTNDIADGEDGFVAEFGHVHHVNTTGSLYGETWNDGDILYSSPSALGGLTNVIPSAPDYVIEIAIVINAHSNGVLFVRPHRYPFIDSLQDVSVSGVSDLDILQWNPSINAFTNTNTPVFNSLSATSMSATTFYGDGSNLTGINDNFTTGATLAGNVLSFDRNDQLSAYTVDLSSLVVSAATDSFTTGATLAGNTAFFDRNDQLSAYTLDLSSLIVSAATDSFTTGATLAGNVLSFDRNDQLSAYTVDLSSLVVSAATDSFTTGATLAGNTAFFDRNDQLSAYTLDLSSLVSSGGTIYSLIEPNSEIYSSSTWSRTTDDNFFVYSENHDSWLGVNYTKFSGARNKSNQNHIFLRYEDGTPYNVNPIRVNSDYVLSNLYASGRDLDSWNAHVLTGTNVSTDSIYNLRLDSEKVKIDNDINIFIASGTSIYLYMSGTSVSYPRIDIYMRNK